IRVNKPLNLLRRTVRLAGVFAAYRALGGTAVVETMGDPKVFKNGRRTEGFSRNVRRAAPTAPCGAIGDARRRSMIHPSDGESTPSRTSLEHRDGSCGPGLIRSGNGVGFHRQKS